VGPSHGPGVYGVRPVKAVWRLDTGAVRAAECLPSRERWKGRLSCTIGGSRPAGLAAAPLSPGSGPGR